MSKRGATLEQRERIAVMGLVDARLQADQVREFAHQDPEGAARTLAEGQQRLDALLIQHATQPGQGERITKMADVMYKVIKTLEPFKGEDRQRIVAEVRQQFLDKGELGAQNLLDRHIASMKDRRGELEASYEKLKHEVDVVHLRKERPRYVRQLEWVEKTWGAVPARDWVGTERHKAMVAGIDPEISVERFVIEIAVEVSSHLAWVALREDEKTKREMFHETIPMMAATLDWTRAGCPVFSLTDDFFHALAVTDFGTSEDDKEDVVHMPFSAFVVNFPPNSILDDVRRMFVYRVAELRLGDKVTPEPEKVDGETIVQADAEVTWRLTRLGLMGNPARFGQWPNSVTRWEFLKARDRERAADYHGSEKVDERDVELMAMARRILANMLSYIESSHGLPQEKHRHGAEPAPVEREHSEPRFRVGRPVRLSPQIRAVLKEGRAGKSWKLGQRHIVRGHWRNQAHGPQRSLRTRKWIEPFWKGPATLDEAFARTYEVT